MIRQRHGATVARTGRPRISVHVSGHFPKLPPPAPVHVASTPQPEKTSLVGMTFGDLRVWDLLGVMIGSRAQLYRCQCRKREGGCGRWVIVSEHHLRQSRPTHCGCGRRGLLGVS